MSLCADLIAINGNSSYLIVNFFRPGGSSKLLCCFVCFAEWHMCVLYKLTVYFMGGQHVFDWDRLEEFSFTIDRSIIKSQIQYHMPKLSFTWANTVHHCL